MNTTTRKLYVENARELLADISRELDRLVFPLSSDDIQGQHIAHAITALKLAQAILRDSGKAKGKKGEKR